jgi:hypothetical protein
MFALDQQRAHGDLEMDTDNSPPQLVSRHTGSNCDNAAVHPIASSRNTDPARHSHQTKPRQRTVATRLMPADQALERIFGAFVNLSSKCDGCGLEVEEYLMWCEVAEALAWSVV